VSVTYSPVKWNRNKRIYDLAIAAGVAVYLAAFITIGSLVWTGDEAISFPILLIRALGTCAFLMLHVVLCIGPLARLDRRFLPVVYNRRHLGVATFLVALGHVILTIGYYHGFGVVNPLLSLLRIPGPFPFEWFGLAAFLILFVMAATSHDFWQKMLGASAWKWLHMLVYPMYALLVLHVLLGALRSETAPVHAILLGVGFTMVVGLHVAVGFRERRRDEPRPARNWIPLDTAIDWIEVGCIDEIAENRAKVVCLPGRERIAVFKYGGRISAVTNVCAHQRGPLGEGKIVDGCISCPWHGWEYRPHDGCSPPPFLERITTYRVRVEGRHILIDPSPLPPGTPVEPATYQERCDG
jgi:DMSO/TMAO reductase YedYZ heme-binding membrane subunit/nitrite reductase/ring-hydroxylating ferredoxin subunit